MVAAYPALANYSHRTLAYKLQELSDMLQVCVEGCIKEPFCLLGGWLYLVLQQKAE